MNIYRSLVTLLVIFSFGAGLKAEKVESAFPDGGLFSEVSVGIYTSFGGLKNPSSISPFTAFSWGYNLSRELGFNFRYSLGTSDSTPSNAYKGSPNTEGTEDYKFKYASNFFDVGTHYKFILSRRWNFTARAFAGVNVTTPDPSTVVSSQKALNPHFGLGLGGEYFTILRHLVLGFDLSAYHIPNLGNRITGVSFSPTVKYFF